MAWEPSLKNQPARSYRPLDIPLPVHQSSSSSGFFGGVLKHEPRLRILIDNPRTLPSLEPSPLACSQHILWTNPARRSTASDYFFPPQLIWTNHRFSPCHHAPLESQQTGEEGAFNPRSRTAATFRSKRLNPTKQHFTHLERLLFSGTVTRRLAKPEPQNRWGRSAYSLSTRSEQQLSLQVFPPPWIKGQRMRHGPERRVKGRYHSTSQQDRRTYCRVIASVCSVMPVSSL